MPLPQVSRDVLMSAVDSSQASADEVIDKLMREQPAIEGLLRQYVTHGAIGTHGVGFILRMYESLSIAYEAKISKELLDETT